jgi:hypothetical protein
MRLAIVQARHATPACVYSEEVKSRWLLGTSTLGPTLALLGVAVVYFLIQLPMLASVPLRWDEVVYLGQHSVAIPAPFFSAPRAFGEAWLVAPVSLLTDDPTIIRLYLAIVSSIAFAVAFLPWLGVRGLSRWIAPLAATLLCTMWVWDYYGSQTYPNLWVAFGTISTIGWAYIACQRSSVVVTFAGATSLAVVAIFRPSDSLPVVVCVVVGVLAFAPLGRLRWHIIVAGSLVVGLVVGWLPWIIDAYQRFGGLSARIREASEYQGGLFFSPNILVQLRVADGPILCRPCDFSSQDLPITACVLWSLIVAFIVLAIIVAVRRRQSTLVLLPIVTGVTFAVTYVLSLNYGAPRFLLAMWACLSIPIAYAVGWLWSYLPSPRAWMIRAPLTALLVVVTFSQVRTFQNVIVEERLKLGVAETIADAVKPRIQEPCAVDGYFSLPISYLLHCSIFDSNEVQSTPQARAEATRNSTIIKVCPPGPNPCLEPLTRPYSRLRIHVVGNFGSRDVVVLVSPPVN